jgi:hypothetical protein
LPAISQSLWVSITGVEGRSAARHVRVRPQLGGHRRSLGQAGGGPLGGSIS